MCSLKGDRLLGQKPPPLVMPSRSSREKAADRMNRQFPAVLNNFTNIKIQSQNIYHFSLYINRYTYIYCMYTYIYIYNMYICAYACACVCTYLPNGRAYQMIMIDKLFSPSPGFIYPDSRSAVARVAFLHVEFNNFLIFLFKFLLR